LFPLATRVECFPQYFSNVPAVITQLGSVVIFKKGPSYTSRHISAEGWFPFLSPNDRLKFGLDTSRDAFEISSGFRHKSEDERKKEKVLIWISYRKGLESTNVQQ
jgi:hypothetical protein